MKSKKTPISDRNNAQNTQEYSNAAADAPKSKKLGKKAKVVVIAAIVVLSVMALIVASLLGFLIYLHGLMNYEEIPESSGGEHTSIPDEELSKMLDDIDKANGEQPGDATGTPSDTGGDVTPPETSAPTTDPSQDVKNILLIGADDTGKNGLSDIMIVVSVNTATGKIVCTSLMRDIYSYIPVNNGIYNKLNASHSIGGTPLLLATIKQNFGISIDNYIKVTIPNAIRIFDELGGLELTLSRAEIKYINAGLPDNEKISLSLAGQPVHLSGTALQIHARNRSTDGGGDFNRTRRQRDILDATFIKLSKTSVFDLYSLLEKFLPLVTTDISKTEFLSYIASSATYFQYEREMFRIPCDGCWEYYNTTRSYVRITDINKTMDEWKSRVYG